MSMHASFHVHRLIGEQLHADSGVQKLESGNRSAYLKLRVGADTVTVYFDDIDDIDRLAFESSNLAREAREAWAQNNSGGNA